MAVKNYRKLAEQLEEKSLCEFATKSTDERVVQRVYLQQKDDFRTEFARDYTRIIHSRAFRRLRHKTQVFPYPNNDHICTRLEHSLHVASISRTIARALRLNTDLVEAISIGHDLGHAPFGHAGEDILKELRNKCGIEKEFHHELHSLRVVDVVESHPDYGHPGLNLTFAVRDGIACHCGESFQQKIVPNCEKKPDQLTKMKKLGDPPTTLEGCVVYFADKIAYLGRDLEDAKTAENYDDDYSLPDPPDEVKKVLCDDNRTIINKLVKDLVEHSKGNNFIMIGDDVRTALEKFKEFNHKHIYKHRGLDNYFEQTGKAMEIIFWEILEVFECAWLAKSTDHLDKYIKENKDKDIYAVLKEFLEKDIRNWQTIHPAQLTIDFIAGMTDSYFIRTFSELFLPSSAI